MSIPVSDILIPKNSGIYPLGYANTIAGGYWSVATTTDRDAIPPANRAVGMIIHVRADNRTYRLVGGIGNTEWVADPASYYVHTQATATGLWTITHSLGYNPNITVMISGIGEAVGTISYPTPSSVATVSFNNNFAGTGFCS